MRLWTIRAVLTALLCVGLGSAALARETITIGAEDDWYPYGGQIKGEAVGLGVDLVRASFAAVGIDVKFASMPYARCLEMVKRGSLLACNEPARTQETEALLLWPDAPLFSARSLIYARAPSTESDLVSSALEGKVVAVTNGFEYGSDFDNNKKIRRQVVTKEISVFRMLAAGRVNYAVAYEKVANWYFKERAKEFQGKFVAVGETSITNMYCAFSKDFPGSANYLRKFNEGFAKIQRNGTFREIQNRWQ